MAVLVKKPDVVQLRRNEKKWTKTLMEAGFTVIPSVFINRQAKLGLQPLDLNIILYLASLWWHADNPPFPSKQTIAAAIGVKSPSTIRKRITRMVRDGILSREERKSPEHGQQSNIYGLGPLIKMATPLAEKILADRKQKEVKRREGLRRRPRLRAVK